MADWRAANPRRVRDHWRRAYWKKKGLYNYEGVALGGMEINPELRSKVAELRNQLHGWNYQYYVLHASKATDAEYDRVRDELVALEAAYPDLADPNSPTAKIGAPVPSTCAKVQHPSPMLSLEKAVDAKAVCKFFGHREGVVEPKVDGISLAIRYVRGKLVQARTRGDGRVGEEITRNVRTIRNVPLVLAEPYTFEVRGEVYITLSDFAKMNEGGEGDAWANPRNIAGGSLKLHDSRECAKRPLSFMACRVVERIEGYEAHDAVLELLEELHFCTTSALPLPVKDCMTMYQTGVDLGDENSISEIVRHLEESRRYQDFPTDGLVFKVNNLDEQQELGEGTTAPRWALAFKYPPEQAQTRITAIEFTVGKTGKITPVANFEPVTVSGSTIQRASLCNKDEIKRLGVGIGAVVMVEKSNEIIPKVIRVVEKGKSEAVLPTVCPACRRALLEREDVVEIFCTNPDCDGQVEAKLQYATGKSALDIDGCGAVVVSELVKAGIRSLSALLAATDFPFLKPAARKKLCEGVPKAMEVPFWKKLLALCIEDWGEQTCLQAATRFPDLNRLVDATDNNTLESLPGVGKVRAATFRQFLKDYGDELMKMCDLGFWVVSDSDHIENAAIAGKSFCITGELPGCSRPMAEEEIRKRGGLAKSGVSRRTDFLVVGEQPGGTKWSAAQRWGTPCLTQEEFFKMMAWYPTLTKPDPDREH